MQEIAMYFHIFVYCSILLYVRSALLFLAFYVRSLKIKIRPHLFILMLLSLQSTLSVQFDDLFKRAWEEDVMEVPINDGMCDSTLFLQLFFPSFQDLDHY